MTRIGAAADQVQQASGLPAVLDAACEAFQEILTVLRAHEDGTSGWFIPFVMAATSAADGRDALLFAPSLPPARQHQLPASKTTPGQDPYQLARDVATLTTTLTERLTQAASTAAGERDRDACQRAAAHARGIHRMVTGTGP